MKYLGIATVFFTAFALSLIAGIMSVSGMIALFAAHALVVGVMMSTLEFGKIVASGWLKFYWKDKTVPLLHKSYLLAATIVLVLLTGIGVFGYLSAGHLEQTAPLANVALQSDGLQRQIDQKQGTVKRLEQRVALLDKNVESFLSGNHAAGGLRASQSLKKERDSLQAQITQGYADINTLNDKLVPLKQQGNEVEAKLGPIKYFGAALGIKDSESAVRLVIVLIMMVFDPLAIVLIISGLIMLNKQSEETDDHIYQNEMVDEPVSSESLVSDPILQEDEIEPEPDVQEQEEIAVPTTPVSEVNPETIAPPFEIEEELAVEQIPVVFPVEDELYSSVEVPYTDGVNTILPVSAPAPVEADVPPVLPGGDEYMGSDDHRERLIRLLQSEPGFLREVEEVIEQIAAERVALENERIRGGLTNI